MAHAVSNFIPNSGDIHQGLTVLNELFGKLFYRELPNGDGWIDHLDILAAVRLRSFGTLKKAQQYYSEILSGYIDVGIAKQSEDHEKAVGILKINKLPETILIDHALNGDFLRLPINNRNYIINIVLLQHRIIHDGISSSTEVKLSEEQIKALNSIYDLYSRDGTLRQRNVTLFMEEWDRRNNLKLLRNWWDNISSSFTITSVGKVLAHSNAQRCDRNLPPFN